MDKETINRCGIMWLIRISFFVCLKKGIHALHIDLQSVSLCTSFSLPDICSWLEDILRYLFDDIHLLGR